MPLNVFFNPGCYSPAWMKPNADKMEEAGTLGAGLRDTPKSQMQAGVSQGSYIQHKDSRPRIKDYHQERSSGSLNQALVVSSRK